MAKRVLTGCRDCKKCVISGVGKAGRGAGRGMAFLMTGGLSEVGMAMTKDCGACGHALSLHENFEQQTGWKQKELTAGTEAAPSVAVEPAVGSAQFKADPDDVWKAVLNRRKPAHIKKRDDAVRKAQLQLPGPNWSDAALQGILSVDVLPEGHARLNYEVRADKMTAWGVSNNPKGAAQLNDRIRTNAEGLVRMVEASVGARVVQTALATAEVAPPAPSSLNAALADPVEQIRKLAELRDMGILSEDEFTAKKGDILSRM